jgi:hypothetical protein
MKRDPSLAAAAPLGFARDKQDDDTKGKGWRDAVPTKKSGPKSGGATKAKTETVRPAFLLNLSTQFAGSHFFSGLAVASFFDFFSPLLDFFLAAMCVLLVRRAALNLLLARLCAFLLSMSTQAQGKSPPSRQITARPATELRKPRLTIAADPSAEPAFPSAAGRRDDMKNENGKQGNGGRAA